MYKWLLVLICSFCTTLLSAQDHPFKQLDEILPTPNAYRNAAGAPGVDYWQQQVDHKMSIVLDDELQKISGTEFITYHNNSPDILTYIWLQLDQNRRSKDSDSYKVRQKTLNENNPYSLENLEPTFDGGFKLTKVTDSKGNKLSYIINKTMMRIDLKKPLNPGEKFSFNIDWWYNINDRMKIGGRSGYEYFPEDDNYLYTIAQFFPRVCMYNDVYGWQNKQFLGSGEFTLNFGNYDVEITVPSDHYVASTGVLQNPRKVLSKTEIDRFERAKTSYKQPVIIVTEDEARKNEEEKSSSTKTWHFKAENVRDFAFASSRKFIWDAMAVKQEDGTEVMAMSMYPKEGNPLWEKYSTKVVAHTLKWYSHYTFPYPYPVAWSIHAARIGMEYPMICFNFGRPEKDGTYDERTKYGMIGVIIHEVGHNYFPMIVNSDERQWTWMDEGLNTFVQYLTEQQFERNFPSRRGPAHKIVDYMSDDKDKMVPIMTNSESLLQFGNNAYGKPATALNILRETVMGRDLFDRAFKEYSRRWMFKHPTPADFFRTMEDVSAVDLDWFWNGWFYTTDHVDVELESFQSFQVSTADPEKEEELRKNERALAPRNISEIRNEIEIKKTYNEIDSTLNDFYTTYDPLTATKSEKKKYARVKENMTDRQREKIEAGGFFNELTFKLKGGLVTPVIFQFQFEDGTKKDYRIPAEIWVDGSTTASKVYHTEKRVSQVILDPYLETADTDRSNNYFPPQNKLSRFELFRKELDRQQDRRNPMQIHRDDNELKP